MSNEIPNDDIFLLSIGHHGGDGQNAYISEIIRDGDKFGLTMSIKDAKVFYSRQDAWNYRESIDRANWQITPISAKKLFTRKLKTA